ncbi:TPA: hypothetical protein CPT82_03700 [Candidatus Gastranaerophilales bacterium HUM_2]|nr:MAG TPA: hypothetical protein CPT82_03700 [Candidatus Gastranaerophilales bacterium HUM_2]
MAGFGIWCEGGELVNEVQSPYDIHFNLWLDYCSKKSSPMFDVGIRINYISTLHRICIYLPYLVAIDDIKDLGKIIVSDKKILDSVFNESYTFQELQESKNYLIKDKTGEEKFIVYTLDPQEKSDISIEHCLDGTVVTINLEDRGFIDGKNYYFRLRFTGKWLNKIIERKSKGLLFDNVSTENTFIDFRLNNWRGFDNPSLVQRIQQKSISRYCICKVNFFLMTNGEIDVYSLNPKSERKLENKIWKDYIGKEIDNVIIATQWQDNKKTTNDGYIESFNVYARFRKQWCTLHQIFKYIIIFAVINILYSLLYNLLFSDSSITIHKIRIIFFIAIAVFYFVILKVKGDD